MRRLVTVALSTLLCSCVVFAAEIKTKNRSSEVRHACARLDARLADVDGAVVVKRLKRDNAALGEEGYAIQSDDGAIHVTANTDAGLANGVYTLLRTIMTEDIAEPFDHEWDVEETPGFRWRSMMVAPYSFGAAHSFSVFSPDMWSLEDWKEYIDYLRLFNLNTVGIYSMRWYDPDIPQTWVNKTRYEIWKGAMDYAHELGMKFAFVQTANGVPQELWWKHPELRNENEVAWAGCALCYSKGKDVIQKTQRHTFEYFKDADYFEFMFSDGGGACYCDECSQDQAAVFIDMVEDAQAILDELGSDAGIVFWNWWLAAWYQVFPRSIPGYLDNYPQVKDIQANIYDRLPRDIVFEDIGIEPPVFAGLPDTLKTAKEKGFETVVDFAYFMNPETADKMFPRPMIGKTIEMAQHAKAIKIDGADGYRLSPHGRVLNDFAFMRLLWNPDLTQDELIDEMGGFFTEQPEHRDKVSQAVAALENYWNAQDRAENIELASRLLDEAKVDEPSYQLEYTADLTYMLKQIDRQLRPELSKEERQRARHEAYLATFNRYILQGFGGTQCQWIPEAHQYFEAYMDIWLKAHAIAAIPLQVESQEN